MSWKLFAAVELKNGQYEVRVIPGLQTYEWVDKLTMGCDDVSLTLPGDMVPDLVHAEFSGIANERAGTSFTFWTQGPWPDEIAEMAAHGFTFCDGTECEECGAIGVYVRGTSEDTVAEVECSHCGESYWT